MSKLQYSICTWILIFTAHAFKDDVYVEMERQQKHLKIPLKFTEFYDKGILISLDIAFYADIFTVY